MIHFGIDIDGTIAARNTRSFMSVCNEQFRLGIEQERLETLNYQDFLLQPEMLAYRKCVGEESFQRRIRWIDLDAQVLVAMLPLSGAVEGVNKVAQFGSVAYYTARYSTEALERNQPMAQATYQWLRTQHFPHASEVVFCESVADKFMRVFRRICEMPQPVVLIDDKYTRLLEGLASFDPSVADLLRRYVTLVAFQAYSVSEECYGLQVVPCPTWRDVEMFVDTLSTTNHRKEVELTKVHKMIEDG